MSDEFAQAIGSLSEQIGLDDEDACRCELCLVPYLDIVANLLIAHAKDKQMARVDTHIEGALNLELDRFPYFDVRSNAER